MTALDLSETGLVALGHCPVDQSDGLPHDGGTLILLGPDEPDFWAVFTASPEYLDTLSDPMDRWSRRTVGKIADAAKGVAYYPFGGAPFHPFFAWALRSGRAWSSPVGFLVHDAAGLFVSYRGAVWVSDTLPATIGQKPCDTCAAPCTSACPVDALRETYDVAACKSHLRMPEGAPCLTTGCAARRACPVGAARRLPAQAAFHMEAFL